MQALHLLSTDPRYPGLHSHEISSLTARFGQEVRKFCCSFFTNEMINPIAKMTVELATNKSVGLEIERLECLIKIKESQIEKSLDSIEERSVL